MLMTRIRFKNFIHLFICLIKNNLPNSAYIGFTQSINPGLRIFVKINFSSLKVFLCSLRQTDFSDSQYGSVTFFTAYNVTL